ncbi:MAG: hypothetical protein KF865_00625 [Bdellovibrionaceae bacterium]|nr:hypothetical protein [Pseudobdellovibrionaceae bacterium]
MDRKDRDLFRLDPSRLDTRRVTILVSNRENLAPYLERFLHHNYKVEVTTDATELYVLLCRDDNPGFVMISTQIEGTMERMMADFVAKRFRVPVLLFEETLQDSRPGVSAEAVGPHVRPIGRPEPESLVQMLREFDFSGMKKWSFTLAPEAETKQEFRMNDAAEAAARPCSERVFVKLREVVEKTSGPLRADVMALHACRVDDPEGRGYFVFAFPALDSSAEPDEALLILESRVREVAGPGAAIECLVQAVPGDFFEKLRERSDEVVDGRVGDREMILLYYRNRQQIEEADTRVVNENFLVPVEDWWVDLPLPVHTYVWLEKNKRRVLYVRPGDRLRPEALSRLKSRGIGHLAIDPADLIQYQRIREMVHVARNAGPVAA